MASVRLPPLLLALALAVVVALLFPSAQAFFPQQLLSSSSALMKQQHQHRPAVVAAQRSRVALSAAISMSDPGFGTGKQAKGGVKVGVKEKEATKTSPKEKEKFEVEWRVLLHNDDVHTFDYVSRKLAEVVPTLTRSKAWECTLAAHSHDFSTIAIVTKTTAEEFCMKLQKEGLTISVAPDSNFKKDGEGGEGGAPQGGKK